MTKLACAGQWRAPSLEIEQFQAIFPDGRIDTSAMVDISTGAPGPVLDLEFGLQLLTPFLTEKLAACSAASTAQSRLKRRWMGTDPAAMDRTDPQWNDEVARTVELAGEFWVNNTIWRGLSLGYAASHFSLTNLVASADLV